MSNETMQIDQSQPQPDSQFMKDIQSVINKHSRESMSDTPDYILAKYLEDVLVCLSVAILRRDQHYQFGPTGKPKPF
jgi:hypothetical protein